MPGLSNIESVKRGIGPKYMFLIENLFITSKFTFHNLLNLIT